jgi:hypothetical protein
MLRSDSISAALALGIALGMALTGCDHDCAATNANDAATPATLTLADLSDGSWTLRVDRELSQNADVSVPRESLSEDDYTPVASPRSHAIQIDLDGNQVLIDDAEYVGSLEATSTDSQHTFDITVGTFAGGRFVVWPDPQGLQAEFTLFGSGVPFAQSERGTLTPNR